MVKRDIAFTTSRMANPPSKPSGGVMFDCRTVIVADHHESVFVCRGLYTETGVTEFMKLPATRLALVRLFLRQAGRVRLYVEACRSWEWESDLCEDRGVELQLIDSSKMPEIWQSTKKTDRNDVEAMFGRLMATGKLPKSYRATRKQRELRGLARRLHELRKARRIVMNQIHALIDAHGMPTQKASFFKDEWQASVQQTLPPDTWLVLDGLLVQIGLLSEQALTIQDRVNELMAPREDAQRLLEIPGSGEVIAATILAEVADISRFPNARAFAAFTGLVPRVRSSAGKAKMGHIARSGPPALRWCLSGERV